MSPNPKNATAMTPVSATPLAAMSDEMLAMTEQDAGDDFRPDPSDLILPLITVFQSNSPGADKRSPDFNGGEPGSFHFRNDLIPVRDGVIGFDAIPVWEEKLWLESGPTRGSGLSGRHSTRPDDVETRINQEDGARRPVLVRRGTNNQLQEVREFYILVDGKPYVLSFHGTGHTTAKRWLTYLGQLQHPRTSKVLPWYAHKYRITTRAESNALGRWFGVHFEDRGCVSVAEYQAAKAFRAVIARGAYRVDMSAADSAPQVLEHSKQAPGVA
jgi:hypothetical protein